MQKVYLQTEIQSPPCFQNFLTYNPLENLVILVNVVFNEKKLYSTL